MVIRLKNPFKNLKWCDVFFAFYLCVLLGNQRDYGFDAIILRLAFFALAAYLLVYEIIIKNRLGQLLRSRVFLWVCALTAFSLASSLWAINSNYSLGLLSQFGQCVIVVCAVVLCYNQKEDIYRALKIVVFAAIYCAIIVYVRTPGQILGIKRLGTAAGINANNFGCSMAIAFCVTLFFAITADKKALWAILSVFFAFFALNSGSRKAFAALVIAAALLAVFANKTGFKKLLLVFAACAVAVSFYILCMRYEPLYDLIGVRIEGLLDYILGGEDSSSGSTFVRLMLIDRAKEIFSEHPFFGVGLNNFMVAIAGSFFVAYAHNNYWEILSTLGIFGFVINYSLYIGIIKNSICGLIKKKDELCGLFLTLMIARLFIDYGMVTFYRPFNIFLLALSAMYVSNALKGEKTLERFSSADKQSLLEDNKSSAVSFAE
ncbi:MAG: O-antigen ligase family protein [Clostridia bacterium]|nr:O-antigen ligase family protein [Clostridia bacterium]